MAEVVKSPGFEDLQTMLREEPLDALMSRAYAGKTEVWWKRDALRGLVEVSNVCARNCLYCGIRRANCRGLSTFQLFNRHSPTFQPV